MMKSEQHKNSFNNSCPTYLKGVASSSDFQGETKDLIQTAPNIIGIGDDIVDLLVTSPRPHKRFIDRVFLESEKDQFSESWTLMWLHWAAKEATFKAYSRHIPGLIFSHKDFAVDINLSQVTSPFGRAYFQSNINDDFVHVRAVTARLERFKSLNVWIERQQGDANHFCTQDQSRRVRELARRRIAEILSINVDTIEIGAEDRKGWTNLPVLKINSVRNNSQLSFSHHGRFVSVTFYANLETNRDIHNVV